MHPHVPRSRARDSLRRLQTPLALDFGTRLLRACKGGSICFREFVAVARAFMRERPEQSAIYLATLVALELHAQADEAPHELSPVPSPN